MLAFMKIPEKQKKYEPFWKQNKTKRIFVVKLLKKGCLPSNLCFFDSATKSGLRGALYSSILIVSLITSFLKQLQRVQDFLNEQSPW